MFSNIGQRNSKAMLLGTSVALAAISIILVMALLLVPALAIYGAMLAAGLMSGAILSHLVVLGVAPGGDPSMFAMAVVAFLIAWVVIWRRRREIPLIGQFGQADEASAL